MSINQFLRLIFLSWVLLLAGCASLPENEGRVVSHAFAMPESSTVGRMLAPSRRLHGEETAFVLLDTGREAFVARASLIDAAERGIDAQYYIWRADRSGRDSAARVLEAADRGVQVRVLLDDFGIGTKDRYLFALDTHPKIQIRLYNPLPPKLRTGVRRWLGMVTDFDRLAPRMHNKLLLVDGAVAIAGGRNIADEYFDLNEDRNFRDRDLMFHGSIIPKAGESFDASWNSVGAYPIAVVSSVRLDAGDSNAILDGLREHRKTVPAPIPVPRNGSAAREALATAFADSIWAPAELYYNKPPGSNENPSFDKPGTIAQKLVSMINEVERTLLIESGYLITGDRGLQIYQDLRERGIRVRALTNSLMTNDVLPLHAGYTRSRRELLASGVELHELRPDAPSCQKLIGTAERCAPNGRLALHAKSLVFDEGVVYVGSYNMNPRSAFLNTETAVIVHSRELAGRIAKDIVENLQPINSWQLDLDSNGALRWRGQVDGKMVDIGSEPSSGVAQRFKSFLFSLIPMEKYL